MHEMSTLVSNYDLVIRDALEHDVVVGSSLIDMYSKCGEANEARKIFLKLFCRNAVAFNTVMAQCNQEEDGVSALELYDKMQNEGINPERSTFSCIIKACASIGAIDRGKLIHEQVVRSGLEIDVVVGSTLIDMYVKCGKLDVAREIFDKMHDKDIVSWGAMITGYVQNNANYLALDLFERMQEDEDIHPNKVVYLGVLRACGCTQSIKHARIVHDCVIMSRFESDKVVGSALVDVYTKCGSMKEAFNVFKKLQDKDVVSWNAIITGYMQYGLGRTSLLLFTRMMNSKVRPDRITFLGTLKACGMIGALGQGKMLHDRIIRNGIELDITIGSALVDMYVKCGSLGEAHILSERIPNKNIVLWGALIAGYAEQDQCHEALDCFEQMCSEGICPNVVTFICILKACGKIRAIDKGKQIHDEIMSRGLLEKDVVLGNALVDMYAKCGMLIKAQQVLEELPVRNLVSWSALIAGYAQQGQGYEALDCFKRMQTEGHTPDEVTFLCVLSACYHSGLLDEAEQLFGIMSREYGITPSIEHHTCMVMVFGAGGNFDKALSVIKAMSLSDFPTIWVALLGACRKWGNAKLGILAFDQTVQLDDSCAAAYVLMANIFAATGMQKDAEKVESMRQKYAGWKNQFNSVWVDETGNAHSFSIGDTKHSRSKEIYAKVQEIVHNMSQEGYSKTVQWVSGNILETGKHYGPCGHSVWLAIACAIIHTQEGETIHVMDNACVCGNCYFATSIMSKIEKRKIMVRDQNNLHIFEPGKCITGAVR